MYRSGRPAKPIAVGAGPSALAVDPTGRLWVADAGAGDVRVVEPATGKQLADIKLGGSPAAIAIGGGDAWVADQRGNDVRRIGLQSLRPAGAAIRTPGRQPGALAYAPSGAVWVVNKGSSDVTVIRDGHAGPAQFVGGGALSISADSTAGVWVGTNSGTVVRLSESGAPQGQPLQLHGGAAMAAALGDMVSVLTRDDATLSSVAPGATPWITARQSMSPAQAPNALSCVPGECAASDQPTRQVVLATF
jgi:YVTN family beta-propeller protein